jgi:translocation and assembly module TamB
MLVTMALALVVGTLVFLHLGGATWAVNRLLRSANPYPGASLRTERVGGNFFTGLVLHGVRLTLATGDVAVRIDSVRVGYNLRHLFGDDVTLREVRLVGLAFDLRQLPDASWDALAFNGQPTTPSARRITIELVSITESSGSIRFRGDPQSSMARIDSLNLVGHDLRIGRGVELRLGRVGLRFLPPGESEDWASLQTTASVDSQRVSVSELALRSPNSSLSGHGTIPVTMGAPADLGQLDFTLVGHPLAFRDLRAVAPRLDRDRSVAITLRALGKASAAAVDLDARFSDGGTAIVKGTFTAPKASRLEYHAQATVKGLDPGLFTLGSTASDRVSGELSVDLSGPRLDRVSGRMRLMVNDSRSGRYESRRTTANGEFAEGRATVDLRGDVAGIAVGAGGWVRPFDSVPSFDLTAEARRLAGGPVPRSVDRWLGTQLSLRVQGRGVDPRRADVRAVATLSPDARSRGLIDSGRVEIHLVDGTAHVSARARATRGLATVTGTVTLGDRIDYEIDHGSIQGIDVAALLGQSTESTLDATWSLRGHGFDWKTARAEARVTIASATYGTHRITDGHLDLGLRDGIARLTATTNLDGGSVELEGNGSPAPPEPTFALRRLAFRHLDLTRQPSSVRGDSQYRSDLSGEGAFSGRGRRLADLNGSGWVTLEQSRLYGAPVDHAKLVTSLSHGALEFQAEADAPSGRVILTGDARPFDSIATYRVRDGNFRDVDLSQWARVSGLHTRLTGRVVAEGAGHEPKSIRGTASVELEPSVVNETAIRTGRLQAELVAGQLRVRGRLQGDGDSLTVDGTVAPFEKRPPLRLEADLGVRRLGPLFQRNDLEGGGTARVVLSGELGPGGSESLRGKLHAHGRLARLTIDSVTAQGRLAGGTLTIDTVVVHSNVGAAAGGGTVAVFPESGASESNFRLQGQLSKLTPLATVLGLSGVALDSVHFVASLRGPRDRLSLGVEAQGAGLVVGAQRASRVQTSLSWEMAADRSVIAGTADLKFQRLIVAGAPVHSVTLQGEYRSGELAVRGEGIVDQSRHAQLVAHAYPATADRRARLDTLVAEIDGEHWSIGHPVDITYGDRIRVNDFVLATARRRIAVNGTVDRRGSQDLTASLDSVPVRWFAGLVGGAKLDGEIQGSLHLTGPAAKPEVSGDLGIALRSGKKRLGNARGRLAWTGTEGARIDLSVRHPVGDSLTVTGRLPFTLSLAPRDSSWVSVTRVPGAQLELDVTANQFGIDVLTPLLDPEFVKHLQGRLTTNARVRGSLDALQMSGELTLADAQVEIPRLRATYDKGQIGVTMRGRELQVTHARFESGGGSWETEGSVRLEKVSAAQLDLRSTLHNFGIAAGKDFRSRVSGAIRLGGTTMAPSVTGAVVVDNSDLYLEVTDRDHAIEKVELTPAELELLRERFGNADLGSEPAGGALGPWAFDLEAELGSSNWLRRRSDPVVAVELAGKVRLQKKPGGDLSVVGAVRAVPGRSFVQLVGRRFNLTSATVRLAGPIDSARVTLKAEYRTNSTSGAQPVIITCEVRAVGNQLTVVLGSAPSMPQEDIMSYLATGRPAGTDPTGSTPDQGPVKRGTDLAVGTALGRLAGGAGYQLGLDVVQVMQDPQGGQTLVAGRYVSNSLYLGFRQPIVAAPLSGHPEPQRNLLEFEVEYAALRQALINLQGGGAQFRLFLRLRR